MKKTVSFIAIYAILFLSSCNNTDEESKNTSLSYASLSGSWEITSSTAVEWEEGVGRVDTVENDSKGAILSLDGEKKSGSFSKDGESTSFSFTLEGTVLTLTVTGDSDPPQKFDITAFSASSMVWDNPEPSQHSDYSERDGNFVYNEKIWNLSKK